MSALWWTLLGLVIGMLLMMPVTRFLLRRAELTARRAERRARNAERLAELGSMTSGLAHEIKNPLSTIGLNAQLLSEAIAEADMPEDTRQRMLRRLDSLRREVTRLGGILTDFLQFAGRIKLDPQMSDLVEVVDELGDFFHPQCDQARVLMRMDLPSEPVPVQIDEALFKQALLNLMINATQAMLNARPADSDQISGELILRVERDEGVARVHVIDTGPGVDPENLEAIFRPYVSHKSGGTGLGLPTSRRIIEEHGGTLEAISTPGQGSDFVIELPL